MTIVKQQDMEVLGVNLSPSVSVRTDSLYILESC
jgi:hypothetical protein